MFKHGEKTAKNLKKSGSPGKANFKDRHAYGHMSEGGGASFGDHNPDKSAERRVKVAKGLMVKR